jgi:1,4-dihydroxy-6-naphthoate synthase
VIGRALPRDVQQRMNRVMRRSVEYAFAHPGASREFVKAHAQEMSEDVMRQHIDLYVNEYSVDLGREGHRAIEVLFERAAAAGVIARPNVPLFVAD